MIEIRSVVLKIIQYPVIDVLIKHIDPRSLPGKVRMTEAHRLHNTTFMTFPKHKK